MHGLNLASVFTIIMIAPFNFLFLLLVHIHCMHNATAGSASSFIMVKTNSPTPYSK